MSDRFRFRAWNQEKGVMVYQDEDDSADYWDGVCLSPVEMVNSQFADNEYVWMQCTGLKDRNGKLVWEGDIILLKECHDSNAFDGVFDNAKQEPIPQVVRFSDAPCGAEMPSDSGYHPYYWEVIGNIYENGNLLNEKN